MFSFVCLLMVGEWGHFAGQLRGPALLLSYLDNSWPKVGLALINRPSAFAEFYFPAPILGRCDLKVRSRYYLWTPPYYPLEQSWPFDGDSDHQWCPVRPSAMRRTEGWAWSPSCTRPSVGGFDGVRSATNSLKWIFVFSSRAQGSPMMTPLPLSLSATSGQTKTLYHQNLSRSYGKVVCWPTFLASSTDPHWWPIVYADKTHYIH